MNDDYTLITTVELDATPEQLWAAWNNAEKVAKWWGPAGFTSTVEELNVQPGGAMRVVMRGPDGTVFPNVYVYDEVHQPDHLVYTNIGSKEFGLEPFQSVVDFVEHDGKTTATLKMRFANQAEKDKHVIQFHAEDGSRELLERLSEQANS